MRQQFKVHFTDFWESFNPVQNIWLDLLNLEFDIIQDPRNPDFLFHSCFGEKHLKYDCVKICIMGENLTPDFNISDFAVSFDHIDYEDRHFRLPIYRLYMGDEAYREYEPEFFANEAAAKKKFCNFIYTNAHNSSPHREQIFDVLSTYKHVDSGGGLRNNVGGRVGDKRAWQRDYKFSIAFENSSKNGYTTEKIYDALCAHTIPIYWGNPRIADDFNPERFINCNDFCSLDEAIAHVKRLDENPDLYLEMLSKPWFTGPVPQLLQDDQAFLDFLLGIFRQGPQRARRTTRNGVTASYYQDRLRLSKFMFLWPSGFRIRYIVRKLKLLLKTKLLKRK